MSEFKGTKGEWSIGVVPDYNDTLKSAMLEVQAGSYWVCKVQNKGMIQREEGQYNAQLISCAPEMLELLNRIEGELLRSDFVLTEKWHDKIQELITKATTI